jgi:hypothetical protein
MSKDDFVNVRLTKLGEELSKGQMQIHEGNRSFYFKPGEAQRVTRAFDWERVLKTQHHNGHPLFEIADAPAASADEDRPKQQQKKKATEVNS